MPKKYIILQPTEGNGGGGVASITESTVTVSITNAIGEYELWLLSSKSIAKKIGAGKMTGGTAKTFELRPGDLEDIDTIILTKNGRTAISGTVSKDKVDFIEEIEEEIKEEQITNNSPLGINDGFTWREITDGSYPENIPIVRHIFSNSNTVRRISKYKNFYYGVNGDKVAVAVPSNEDEDNAFKHLNDCAKYINGYWVVCADKKDLYFYTLE